MPNIASLLKSEISRIARKEIRSEVSSVKKANAQHRAHIALLRRKVEELERALKQARRDAKAENQPKQQENSSLRFRASGLASHRKRLGLSAADFGRLVGVSGQTIYKWESGEVKPRMSQLEAIAAVRKMGRRESLLKLAQGT